MSIAAPVVFGGALLRAPASGAAIFIVYYSLCRPAWRLQTMYGGAVLRKG